MPASCSERTTFHPTRVARSAVRNYSRSRGGKQPATGSCTPRQPSNVESHQGPLVEHWRGTAHAARFQHPPFKPCVRFSRTRLTDGLPGVACAASNWTNGRVCQRTSLRSAYCARPLAARCCLARAHRLPAALRAFSTEVLDLAVMPSRLRLFATTTEAGPLPSGGLSPTSSVLWTPRTPFRLPAISAFRLIRTVSA